MVSSGGFTGLKPIVQMKLIRRDIVRMEIKVPKMLKMNIDPMFLKNGPLFTVRAPSNRIGGRRMSMKICWKACLIVVVTSLIPTILMIRPIRGCYAGNYGGNLMFFSKKFLGNFSF